MRLRTAALALGAMSLILATAHAADGLSERQQLIRQVLRQDTGEDTAAPARLPPLKCGKNDYSIKESGKRTVVTEADSLKSALKGAKAGDVIVLGAGDYGWIDLNNYQFSNYVAIKGTPGAKIQHIGMKNVKNIQLDSINLEYGSAAGQTWQPKGIEITESENVRIVNSVINGNPTGTMGSDQIPYTGIRFLGGKNYVLANNKIGGWQRAVLSQSIDGFLYEHNVFSRLYADGFMAQLTHNGAIQSNYFPDGMHHNGGPAHADYFQFDAGKGRHSSKPDSNIAIRGNVMLQGPDGSKCSNGSDCGAVQGIFLGGAMGYINGKEHVYTDFTITDNFFCASGMNGITSGVGARNILIKNNVHYTCPPPFGGTHTSRIAFKGDPQINSKIENNITGKVASTAEGIAKAKQFTWLNNCILKGL